ncbi:MAG: hypothetical protein HOV80_25135 [Polyangiaceae bacterium]|nr:hypothetical protein [Polyangiaceae bacterium]
MFRRLVLVLVGCVAPLLLALFVEARPVFADEQATVDVAGASGSADGAAADRAADIADEGVDAVEEDVAGFEPTAIRSPSDPRERSPYEPCELREPTPLRRAVLTRPPV